MMHSQNAYNRRWNRVDPPSFHKTLDVKCVPLYPIPSILLGVDNPESGHGVSLGRTLELLQMVWNWGISSNFIMYHVL
jgi:hypothetical protein